jgi:ACR3 family arsenite transporter
MSSTEHAGSTLKPVIGFFERYLTVWVALCIVGGIVLGQLLPGAFQAIGRMEVAHVNLPVAVPIWIMINPMLQGRRRVPPHSGI